MINAYIESDVWFNDVSEAVKRWRVDNEQTTANRVRTGPSVPLGPCRLVSTSAGTGSRYTVVVTDLGGADVLEGAPLLVSVTSPWHTCYPFQPDGLLHWQYVMEKLLPEGRDIERVHAGDLAALVMTIAYALGRPFELPEKEEKTEDDSD